MSFQDLKYVKGNYVRLLVSEPFRRIPRATQPPPLASD